MPLQQNCSPLLVHWLLVFCQLGGPYLKHVSNHPDRLSSLVLKLSRDSSRRGTPDHSGLNRPHGGCSLSPLLVVAHRSENRSDSFGNAGGVCTSFRGERSARRAACENVTAARKAGEKRVEVCKDDGENMSSHRVDRIKTFPLNHNSTTLILFFAPFGA